MAQRLLIFFSLFFSTGLLAQLSEASLSGLSFRSLGPAFASGRIADIAVNPDNHSEYYVGVASGGVWKTTNHGVTFQPLFDQQSSYSIGCLALDPQNPKVVWVGTGENNNQRSVAYGDGIYKSEDGGKSWQNMGLENSEHIGMIRIHPNNPDIVYVAAYGPLWSSGGERGIYKSEDGGESWERILEVSEHTGFNEIHLDPRNPDVLYAAAHQRRRHVWTYVSGGPESAIYKSANGGKDWQKLDKGLPGEDLGRIGLAIAPADPDKIYAMVEGHGLYRSDDRGASFEKQNDYHSSGNYYVELVPHPNDPEVVYSMDTYLQMTRDGGKNWERVPRENRHVDDHCLWINPKDPQQMIVGSDGGLYETYDNAQNWHYKRNLPVTQFYRVAVDNDKPFYNVYGGTQDNFSVGGPSQTINDRGIVNSDWYVTNTGDGFKTQVDPENPNIVYAQAQYGWLVRYDRKSGEKVGLKPTPPEGEKAYRWNWDAPLLISPHDHERLYFAANKVFRSEDRGNHWRVISPDLSRQLDRHQLPVMGKIQSVDAVAYDKSTSVYGNIVSLDESPQKEGLLYAGTDDGLIQLSDDGGENWQEISSFPGVPKRSYTQQVQASRHDPSVVYAAFNNHKNGDFKPYLLRSEDRGQSWQSLAGDLPEKGSIYCFLQDPENPDLLFVGTEYGVHFSTDGGENWQELSNGLPTIAVRDMVLQEREHDLVIATFGRGFYVLDDIRPLRHLQERDTSSAHLFPVPEAMVFMEASPNGYGKAGFQGASYYMAPNPEQGAQFSLYLPEVPQSQRQQRRQREAKKREKEKDISYPPLDSLRAEEREEENYLLFVIKNEAGSEVDRFTEKPQKGLARYYWNGRLAGRTSVNSSDAPHTQARDANLAPPGSYAVDIYQSVNGELRPLGTEERAFELHWLEQHSFQAQDRQALAAFQDSLESVSREFARIKDLHKKLKKRNKKLKSAARNTPGVPVSLLNSLREVDTRLADLRIALHGDPVRKKHEFETAPSLSQRINTARYNSYSTTSRPTGEQRKNLGIVQKATAKLAQELEELQSDQRSFYQTLLHYGAPYLDGMRE